MKTNLVFLFAFIGIFYSVNAQDIPNSNFENWTNQFYFSEPDDFSTTNIISFASGGPANVHQSSDAYSGSYAIQLETVDLEDGSLFGAAFIGEPGDMAFYGGIPFNERPDALTGFAKFDIAPNDTAYAILYFKLLENPLGYCFATFYGNQPEYQEFSAPVTWFIPFLPPDTLVIALVSSSIFGEPVSGSTITFDNLQFDGASTPFPNGDFENWTDISTDEPDNWFSSNLISFAAGNVSVTQSSDSYEGDFAVRIESTLTALDDTLGFITNGTLGEEGPEGGMPVNSIPDKISGYYKYIPVGPDTALAAVGLFHYNQSIDSTEVLEDIIIKLPPVSAYTYFEVPVEYYSLPEPDTVNIAFGSGNFENEGSFTGLGSSLWIDALEITYKPPVSVNENATADHLQVYPNPADNDLFIAFKDLLKTSMEVAVFDIYGKLVYKETILPNGSNKHLDVSQFKSGPYFYKIARNNKVYEGKIMVR